MYENESEVKKAKPSFAKKFFAALLLGITFGVMAGGAFWGVTKLADHFLPFDKKTVVEKESDTKEQSEEKEEPKLKKSAVAREQDEKVADKPDMFRENGLSVSEVVKNAMPSVVSITNTSVQQYRSLWGMGIQEFENVSAGSGIILGENEDELLIATNNHVIENAKTLTVGFVDEEVYEASVKGADSDRDIAIVAVKLADISDDTRSQISEAVLGDSDELEVGEQVVAIGNALGYGQSVTTGIVSALNREVTIENITNNLIQTDAAINPGNSGGALLNMKGELIGINSAKFASTQVEGFGFAIPVSTVQPIAEELMKRKTREILDEKDAGYFGISGMNVDADVSNRYGIPKGVYLQEVTKDSPADKAGLMKGDVIKKFDGITIDRIAELKENLLYYKPGETVDVVYYRADNGEYTEKTTKVTLAGREGTLLDPDNQDSGEDENSDNGSGDSGNAEIGGEGGYPGYGDFPDIFNFDIGSFFGR